MTHYDDILIPTRATFGTSVVPRFNDQVLINGAGYRSVVQRWSRPLARMNLAWAPAYTDSVAELRDIWMAIGAHDTCLARDWTDWNTTQGQMQTGAESLVDFDDQPLQNTVTGLLLGDGATKIFQAGKRYVSGGASLFRPLTKLQANTISAGLAGVEQTMPTQVAVVLTTGVFTFVTAPGAGAVVTWGGAFYIPVGFIAADAFSAALVNQTAQQAGNLIVEEARL